ncbi:MFS transporter [Sebaldella sp. S0638]|uniref:MFS transporter n=1 Tax=Sebaldella sp. S0638 TaxID=2957809 RepID=UPI00209E2B59|nr:MFS transporter [Sebaldella sp. S0638]MCP1225738.1 MFS transporter [Sebaldella sp. S0638]
MDKNETHSHKNKWIILITVLLLIFMSTLDGSIVNVALPALSRELGVSNRAVSWVVSSYLITICTVILIFGKLGDLAGKTRVFRYGVLVFTFGSFLCGFSSSLTMLIFSRALQAVGAAAAMATSQGIITQTFPKHERGKALGLSGTFVALGSMTGPPLGGFLISLVNWNYIFYINVPIGIIAFIFCLKFLPEEKYEKVKFPDIKGFLLFSVSVISLFIAIIEGETLKYTNPVILACFFIAVVSFAVFIYVEKNTADPMLDLNIFKSKLFSISIFCAFIVFIATSSVGIIQPFYLQYTMKFSPEMTGLLMMAYPVIISVTAPSSGTLSDKIESELLTFLGLTIISIGLFLMVLLNEHTPTVIFLLIVVVMAFGAGLFQSPNNSLIMSTVEKDKLGIAGSVNALVRNLGMSVGTAMSTAVLYSRMSSLAGHEVTSYITGRDDIFINSAKYVYITAGVLCIIGAFITFMRLHNSRVKHF